jgi:hypothetical protein
MDMNYIPTNLKINIEWTVMKGVGNEAEDFSRSAVALFLFSEENRWAVPCVADYTGVVKAQLPETLAEGVYSLDLIWVKNDGSVKGSRCIQRTRKPCVFVVDAGTQPPAGYEGQPVTVEIRTVAAPYGYDGLSAYEIAVLRDTTTLDEQEWSKGLFNDVLANELKRNQDEIAEAQEDISKAQGDIQKGKNEVQSLRKTVESLAASGGGGGGGASVASAVYFDNENTTLYGANVQDAVEELSSKVDSAVSNVVPTTNDNGDCVLGVETFGHGEDPEYQELPMPKASSYNDGVMSKEDSKLLHDMKQAAIADHMAMYPLEVQISGVSNPYEEGEENRIQINLEAFHKGEALSEGVKFTVNGKEVNEQPYTLVATRSVNIPVSAEYAGYAYLGEELTLSKDVTLRIVCVKPCYIGGNMFEDINFEDHVNESDGFAKYIKTSPAGTYTIGLEEAGYIWICVPLEMTVSKVTSGGFDVPVTEYRKTDLNDNVYRCYRSDNKLVAGNYTITIS